MNRKFFNVMLKSSLGRLTLQPLYYLIKDFPLPIRLMIQGKIPALFTIIQVSMSVINQLLNLQTAHQGYRGRTNESVVYLLIKRSCYGKKLIIVYTLIASKSLLTHSLVGVLLIKELVGSFNRIGFTYKQTTGVACEAGSEKRGKLLQQLDPLPKQTLDDELVAYFTDGVHPTGNAQIL